MINEPSKLVQYEDASCFENIFYLLHFVFEGVQNIADKKVLIYIGNRASDYRLSLLLKTVHFVQLEFLSRQFKLYRFFWEKNIFFFGSSSQIHSELYMQRALYQYTINITGRLFQNVFFLQDGLRLL